MEPYLADRDRTRSVLERHGFFIKKGYGQNFLVDPAVPRGILEAARIGQEDTVFEIGPGIGTLTQYLGSRARRVIALELDRKLAPLLAETLAPWPNIQLIWGDVLKQDLPALFRELAIEGPVKVAANLPYYITTPILMRLFEHQTLFSGITVMVQKEVGERMAAGPGSKDYGALSLSVQYYADPRLAFEVPPAAFIPQPRVSSAVVSLTERSRPAPELRDRAWTFSLIRAAFMQRRKMLSNALTAGAPGILKREQVAAALSEMGLDPAIRGERLSLEQFAELSNKLWAETHPAPGDRCE